MTLDEARKALGITATATADEIREAFRRRARDTHPDRSPDADVSARERLAREFDRVREARDILIRYTTDAIRNPTVPVDAPAGKPTEAQEAPSAPPPSSPSSRTPPPRVTMRLDEFIAWTDAAGFTPTSKAPPATRLPNALPNRRRPDWARRIAWSTVGVVVIGLVVMAATQLSAISDPTAEVTSEAAPASTAQIEFQSSFVTDDPAYAAPECQPGCWIWDVVPVAACQDTLASVALFDPAQSTEPIAHHQQNVGPVESGVPTRVVVIAGPGMPEQAAIQSLTCSSP